jgi:hypothetical protein
MLRHDLALTPINIAMQIMIWQRSRRAIEPAASRSTTAS